MKLLMENWRKFINEITTLDPEISQGFKQAVESSQFWTMPHSQEDVDVSAVASDQEDDPLTTPAAEALMTFLNQRAQELGTDLYFIVTVSDEYPLSKDDPHGGYPNNWMKHAMYQGPLDSLHVIWIDLRPLAEDYDISDLDPAELAAKVSRTINHEMVHYHQLKKQSASKGISDEQAWEEMLADPKQLPQTPERTDYLSRHIEIDAYAHEAAEELVATYGANEALELIKRGDSDVIGVLADYRKVFKNDRDTMKKFLKKLYSQIVERTQ